MKRTKSGLKHRSLGCPFVPSKWALRVTIGSLALMLGTASVGAPPPALAAPISASSISAQATNATVYLFDASNNPVLAPNALIDEGGVYTDAGFIGAIDASYRIISAAGEVVGYVTYPSPN